ncbi:MAG: terminase gpA endonuclease subunit [Planctomycetota bacterium]
MSKREAILELIEDASDDEDLAFIEGLLDQLDDEITIDAVPAKTRGEKILEASAKAKTKAVRDSQDIGRPPEGLGDPQRRRWSDHSLLFHLGAYYPETFHRNFDADLLKVIGEIEDCVDNSGARAYALPRGAGKTSILIRAVIWAVLTGRRRFVSLLTATDKSSRKLMRTIKKIILTNKRLHEDYAEELHCLISLGNRSNLAGGQHVGGMRTAIVYESGMLTSGFIEGRDVNEFVISCVSITGDVRGQHHVTVDQETVRPDCLLADDPQTKASARSKAQVKSRTELLNGDALKLAGERNMAAFAAVTIIKKRDMADQLTDRSISKRWRGVRIPLVKEWPGEDAMKLWKQFAELYETELENDQSHDESRQFVIDHFDALHDGAEVFMRDKYDRETEVSALHHAVIEKTLDEDQFEAEFQHNPKSDHAERETLFELDVEEIKTRTVPTKRLEVPEGVEVITAFIDVQKDTLPYSIIGWTLQGRGYVLDYGAHPSQGVPYWTKQDVSTTLSDVYGALSGGDLIRAGLEDLTEAILGNDLYDADGERAFSVDKLAIDVGWKLHSDAVRTFARESVHRSRIHPYQGRYVGARSKGWQKTKRARRERGINCELIDPPKGQRGNRELSTDINWWKSKIAEALTIPATSEKAVVLFEFEPNDAIADHLMIAEHWGESEYCREVTDKGGHRFTEWKAVGTGQVENDYWDCLVGCAALASTLGVFREEKRRLDMSGFRARAAARRVG